jgi:hypothetical protein
MKCLHCGHCCKNLSPFGEGICKYLKEYPNKIFLCSIYDRRPKECRKHIYPMSICPIGLDILQIQEPYKAAIRIDQAWEIYRGKIKGEEQTKTLSLV